MSAPFDTHAFYTELVESGLEEKTANALTKAVTKIEQAKLERLANKKDLKEIELKIEQTKTELQRFIITVVLGVGIMQTAFITLLLIKLIH